MAGNKFLSQLVCNSSKTLPCLCDRAAQRAPLPPPHTHAVALTFACIADLCGLFLRSLGLSDKFAFYEVDSVYSTPMSSRTLAQSVTNGSSSF